MHIKQVIPSNYLAFKMHPYYFKNFKQYYNILKYTF